jgi:hypothetical protein
MKKTAFHALLALLATAAFGPAALAQATLQDRIATVHEQYHEDAWALGAMRDGILLGSQTLPGLHGGAVRLKGDVVLRSFRLAEAPADAAPALIVEAVVTDDVESAQERLMHWLAGLSSPQAAPADTRFGVDLGQAGYVGPSGAGPHAFSWVAFVQGNVAVRLLNADVHAHPALDLPKLAAAIDAGIVGRAPLAPGAAVLKPQVAQLGLAAEAAVVAGQPVRLDVGVIDPIDGTPVLAWSLGGAGQGYVEQRGDAWYLFPTGPGAATVTLSAVGSTGTVATRAFDVDIADD